MAIGGRAIYSSVNGTRASAPGQRLDRRLPSVAVSAIWLIALLAVSAGILTSRWGGATDPPQALIQGLGAVLATSAGAVVATRLPRNSIGWLFLIAGAAGALGLGATDVADYGLVAHPGSVPGAIWLAWFSNWIWAPYIVTLGWFVPLLFPSGSLPSARWRIVLAVGIACIVAISLESALSPLSGGQFPAWVRSPLVIGGPAGDALGLLTLAATGAGAVTLPLVAWSLAQRYRRGSPIERQQLKWFLAVVGCIAPALLVGLILSGTYSGIAADISNAAWFVVIVGTALLPVPIGIAVLRYRLYEIDRLVSRGVSYGALTILLAGLFVALVLALQAALAPLTGSSELAVAGSTLVVAGLFQPLRQRVQRLVDRRFNRAHYDAERAMAALGARLRDEVDPVVIASDIRATAGATLEPASVSVWLRRGDGQARVHSRAG